jgi:nucleoside-diphosphate-sugar epimerase
VKRALVAGAGGFIGGHLVRYLKDKGYWVRGVDIKEHEFFNPPADEFVVGDLRQWHTCYRVTRGIDEVYQLAANMGGAGYVFTGEHDLDIMRDNVLINTLMLDASRLNQVERYFFSSSACIYPQTLQETIDDVDLAEGDAYPAFPDSEYGWEKLFTERMCLQYGQDTDVEVRVARFYNIFGTLGSWNDGREKAPAALCRKVAEAKLSGDHTVNVWGDGKQTRSFCYIDDCLDMVYALMQSDYREPINIGTDEMVSINDLVDLIADIAGIEVEKEHDLTKPQGVRGRNADLTQMRRVLGIEPQYSLKDGMEILYRWILSRVTH